MKVLFDIGADRIWISAYDVKVFGEVQALDEPVYHERADGKPEERVKPRLDIEYKTSGKGNDKICSQKSFADVQAGIFLHNHSDDVCPSAGRANVKKHCRAERREGDGKGEL